MKKRHGNWMLFPLMLALSLVLAAPVRAAEVSPAEPAAAVQEEPAPVSEEPLEEESLSPASEEPSEEEESLSPASEEPSEEEKPLSSASEEPSEEEKPLSSASEEPSEEEESLSSASEESSEEETSAVPADENAAEPDGAEEDAVSSADRTADGSETETAAPDEETAEPETEEAEQEPSDSAESDAKATAGRTETSSSAAKGSTKGASSTDDEDAPEPSTETASEEKSTQKTEKQENTSGEAQSKADESAEQESVFPPAGADGVCGKRLSWTLRNHVLTISGTGEMYDYVGGSDGDSGELPPWSSLLEETEIGIQSVIIEEGVTSIGDFAFFLELDLTEVSLPSTLRSIGTSAFGWSGLSSVTLPNGLKTIGEGAFLLCDSLRKVSVPGSVTRIGADAFSCCGELASVSLSEGLKTIGEGAFEDCPELKTVTVPESVTAIGERAFGYRAAEAGDAFETVSVDGFYLSGTIGSAAQTYARENGFPFRSGQKTLWPLSTPKLSGISASSGATTVRWKKVSGAAWYRVYRKTSGGSWKAIGETASTSYADKTSGRKGAVYTVRCISGQGGSYLSDYDHTGLSAGEENAFVVTASGSGAGIRLRWKAVSGADNYRVYRDTGSGFQLMATVRGAGYLDGYEKTDGRSYSYRVFACSGEKQLRVSPVKTICWEESSGGN